LIGCFPLSIFALRAFKRSSYDTPYQKHFKLWMMILFWVVLILFSIVRTKIVHYSSLCYFPLSFLGAYAIYKLINEEIKWKRITSILLMTIAGIIGIAISALPFLDKYKQKIIEADIIKDKFGLENLKANVHWTGFEWLIGAVLIIGTGIMLILISRGKTKWGIIGMFFISLFTVNMSSVVIAPRIEQYSQGAAIEFYESLQNKDCYVETIGFKSYAHLFYSRKKPQANLNSYNTDWLLKGPIDKPTYFVSKITSVEEIEKNDPELKEIYRKNGFVFWMREVKK
ncbi:MAG: ArnT family glycosyltransferase, partial [Bacteroidia bacterium]